MTKASESEAKEISESLKRDYEAAIEEKKAILAEKESRVNHQAYFRATIVFSAFIYFIASGSMSDKLLAVLITAPFYYFILMVFLGFSVKDK